MHLLRFLVCALCLTSVVLPPTSTAQNVKFLTKLMQNETTLEDGIKQHRPNFRLVRKLETFSDRINAVHKVDVNSSPEGAIATLHDIQTGEPLETCKTPCQFHIAQNQAYMSIYYKFGHRPVPRPISAKAPAHKVWLGINYLDVLKQQKECWDDYKAGFQDDGDAAPCVRVPPIMPPMAKKSGHCKMLFDVSPKGRPENIKTTYCSQTYYAKSSIESVKWWFYTPKVERGQAVTRYGVESKITFKLSDEEGNIIPE